MSVDETGRNGAVARSRTFAPFGRPTELETSAMVPSSIKISVGPSALSLKPSNSLPQIMAVFVTIDLRCSLPAIALWHSYATSLFSRLLHMDAIRIGSN